MQITILHTNDVHSCFEEYGHLVSSMRQYAPEKTLVFDSGDFSDYRSVLISGTYGLGGLELLKYNHTNGEAIGNNEFFGGLDNLLKMINSGFPILSANLTLVDGSKIPGLKECVLIEKQGIRFLAIATSPYFGPRPENQVFLKMEGLASHDPIADLRRILDTYKGQYDYSILLSHQGYKHDLETVQQLKDLDLILGGHSHTLLTQPVISGKTLIAQSGAFGKNYLKLVLDFEDHKLESWSYSLEEGSTKIDPGFQQVYDAQLNKGQKEYSKALCVLPGELPLDHYGESKAPNILCDILLQEYGGDFALINNGVLSAAIPQIVSKHKLLEAAPSPLNPTMIPWTGKQITEALELSFNSEYIHQEGKGPGFRGTCIGSLSFSYNVQIKPDLLEIIVSGKPLKSDQTYQVISCDYLQRGTAYPMLKVEDILSTFYRGYLRDALERGLLDPANYQTCQIPRYR